MWLRWLLSFRDLLLLGVGKPIFTCILVLVRVFCVRVLVLAASGLVRVRVFEFVFVNVFVFVFDMDRVFDKFKLIFALLALAL